MEQSQKKSSPSQASPTELVSSDNQSSGAYIRLNGSELKNRDTSIVGQLSTRFDQLTHVLAERALEKLGDDFDNNKICSERLLAAALGAKKSAVDTQLRQNRLRQEQTGVLTGEMAVAVANDFIDSWCVLISDVCRKEGIDADAFLRKIVDHREQLVIETILSKAETLAKQRLSEIPFRGDIK